MSLNTRAAYSDSATPVWLEQQVPDAYASLLKKWGSPRDISASRFNISLGELLNTMASMLENESDYLASELGWQLQPTAYGDLGQAMMCTSSLRNCLELLQDFSPLVSLGVSSFDVTQTDKICTIHHMVTPWVSPDVQNLWNAICLFSWRRSFHFLLGRKFESRISLNHSAPISYDAAQLFERFGQVDFDQAECSLSFSTAYLDLPLVLQNSTILAQALTRCRERQLLSYQYEHRTAVAKVRSLLKCSVDGYPRLEALADKLHISPRSLRRHLAAEGFTYSVLLEQARMRDAADLLTLQHIPIQQVAESLGYSDSSNFARDFRQWVGSSPSEYRRLAKGKSLVPAAENII